MKIITKVSWERKSNTQSWFKGYINAYWKIQFFFHLSIFLYCDSFSCFFHTIFHPHTKHRQIFQIKTLFSFFGWEKSWPLKKYIQNCTCQSIDGFFNFPIKKLFNYFFDFFPIEYWVFHTEIIKIILIYMEKTVSWWSRLKNGVKRKTHEKTWKVPTTIIITIDDEKNTFFHDYVIISVTHTRKSVGKFVQTQ